MKSFLRHIVLFCAAFIPFYILACIVWGEIIPPNFSGNLKYKRGGHGHTLARTHEAKSTVQPDILFLGSSHCFRGFDPRIFTTAGYSTFNLGTNAQTPRQTEVLFHRYIKQIQPHSIIIEVYPELFEQDGEEAMLDLISNDTIDRRMMEHAFELADFRIFHTLGFALYKQEVARNAKTNQPYEGFGDVYVSGGYCRQINQVYKGQKHFSSRNWTPTQEQLNAFDRILAACEFLNIEVILIQSPVISGLYKSRIDNEKIDQYFRAKGTYFNFNEEMDFRNENWFFDEHHLNQAGVDRFNQALLEKLKTSHLLNK